jgi:D-glycero-D-manno-heptose 1,7-bisphosphate phosphatase
LISYPRQAIILCGGLGTRLLPLTENLPKPMVKIMGKPFLEYLIEQLSEQGLNHFILLTGYLGDVIKEYFGDGSKWGWRIDYSHGPKEWDTGRRLWEAKSKLEDNFLLLYSDNFVQFNLKKLISVHRQKNIFLSLLLAPKPQGNIKISIEGKIKAYINNRIGEGLNYVEVGYMLVNRDYILSLYPQIKNYPDINFSKIIEILVKKNQINGIIVKDTYHSISDVNRLKLTQEYLKLKKIILIDRDGVINVKAPKGKYISNWNEFIFIDDTVESMKQLANEGFSFIIVTNQAGVARGMISEKTLSQIHKFMIKKFESENIKVHDIYICPHHWDNKCECRKPEAGLFFQISKKYMLRMDRTIYIGDDTRDVEAAFNAGCGSVLIAPNSHGFIKNKPKWSIKVNKLSEALPDIFSYMTGT